MTWYMIKVSSVAMPGGWSKKFGSNGYRRIGLLEVDDTVTDPTTVRIDIRCKGVVRIVKTWEQLNSKNGRSTNTAFRRAMREAQELLAIYADEFTRMVWEKGG